MENKFNAGSGGYRTLKTFQLAQLIYDLTFRFCTRYVSQFSRTREQMIQAARSGVQNIAEGSVISATSVAFEINLTNVARASLEELRLDYLDFLRQHNYARWEDRSALRTELIKRRYRTADQVVLWIKRIHEKPGQSGQNGRSGPSTMSTSSTLSKEEPIQAVAANAIIVLLDVTIGLLFRQLQAQSNALLDRKLQDIVALRTSSHKQRRT